MTAHPLTVALTSAALACVAGTAAGVLGATATLAVAIGAAGAGLGVWFSLSRDQVEPTSVPAPAEDTVGSSPIDLTLLDALPIGLMVVDQDRAIVLANTHFEQMFGGHGVVGQHMSLLRSNRLAERIEDTLTTGTESTLEFTLLRAGNASLKAHIRPLVNRRALVVIEDETQSKRAAEVHRDFVSNASHELKTPLAASSGIIETLLGHARSDPAATERFLGMLQSQVTRMTGLVEDLMSLNRIELNARILPSEKQNLTTIIAHSVDALAPVAAQSGVTLQLDLPDTIAPVIGDNDQLAQIFANLVDNAIKYGGKDTTVRIFMESLDREPGMIGISVADQGPGIAREHLPRLTERFYRVNIRRSREAGGTGLGLAIVKHILNRHQGRLEISSQPDQGSTFTVWLPVSKDSSGKATQSPDSETD